MNRDLARSLHNDSPFAADGLILASSSPRRREILEQRGFHFAIVPAGAAELFVPYCSARELVLWNALRKAREVAARHPLAVVIGADTLVDFEGRILGKPATLREAERMLLMLSGREHKVHTGVAVLRQQPFIREGFCETSIVKFRPLTKKQIRRYIEEVNPLDKAGAYGAQESASVKLVESIHGSLANVYGLPIEKLLGVLATLPGLAQRLRRWRSG